MHLAIRCERTRTHIHTHQSDCMIAFYILRLLRECFLILIMLLYIYQQQGVLYGFPNGTYGRVSRVHSHIRYMRDIRPSQPRKITFIIKIRYTLEETSQTNLINFINFGEGYPFGSHNLSTICMMASS